MSSEIYPISLIERLGVQQHNRVIADEFESGETSTRRIWPTGYFKRRFSVKHAPLTLAEFAALKTFYAARDGTYDSFYFRDIIHGNGSKLVRFATDLQAQFQASVRDITVIMDEVGASPDMGTSATIAALAGTAPFFWHDPDREPFYYHMGTLFFANGVPTSLVDPIAGSYPASWQAGPSANNFAFGPGPFLRADGTGWAKSSANVTKAFLGGVNQPALTLFAICKHSSSAANQVLLSVGGSGANESAGLAINSSNNYSYFKGTAFGGSILGNSPASTARSFALTYTAATNDLRYYVDGALLSLINITGRTYNDGPVSLLADGGGTNKSNPSNAMSDAGMAQALMFAATLSLAQVKALHNYFAPLYGLTAV